MKVTVYSMKGGVGKTPIAANLALEKGFALGTNEPFNTLEHLIDEERLMTISPEDEFPLVPDDISIVFDLAGIISEGAGASIASAVRQSDVVIVPICKESKALHGGVNTIAQIEALNPNILIVATKLEKQKGEFFTDWAESKDFKTIAAYVEARLGKSYPILPLKKSTAYDRIFEDDMSISSLRKSDVLLNRSFKIVGDQFTALITALEGFEASTDNVVALNA